MFWKISLFPLCVILIALFFRIIFLDRIPTGVSNDEIDYLLNAKSVFLTGSDISHTWNPLTFTTPKSSFPQAEIAPLLTFLFVGMFPFSLLMSKLIYVLFSVGIVILIYLITKNLIGEKEAVVSGLVASCNPWLIFFGRSAYDTTLAVFFFLLGFYTLLIAKKWYILLSLPVFFIGFYAYIGAKLLLLPFVFVITTFAWYSNKMYKKQYIILFTLCTALLIFYISSIMHTSGTRVNELASPNMDSIASSVNFERRLSIHTPLITIFSNKYVIFGKYALDKYFNTFSPNFLFISGDGKEQFTLWTHGVFYYLDGLFLLIGLAVLFSNNKKVLSVLSALVIIVPIPSILSTVGTSYAIRSMLLAPLFVIFIAVGISYVIKSFRFSYIVICIVYLILIFNFVNTYFLRNPIYNSESFNFSARVLAKYLSFQSQSVYVINGNPTTPYKQYLFYNNGLNKNTANKIATDYKDNSFLIKNIHFITCTQFNEIPKESVVIYDKCKKVAFSNNDIYISQLSDGGSIYTISNDNICSRYSLNRYPYGITFSDLNVEKLSAQEFCTKFINKH